jgi:protein TonB
MSESSIQKRLVLGAFVLAAAGVPIVLAAKSAVAQGDDALIPLLRVAPNYPPRALSRGENGAVALRFTIDVDGTTKDIEIVESSARYFEAPAVAALSRWRYSPPVENGRPVEKRAVETVLRFDINGRAGKLPSEKVQR